MGYLYILKSLRNGRYYIGSTNNLERRLKEHNTGQTKYTKYTIPFEIAFSYECVSLEEARKLEKKLKKFKSKTIIDKIIESGHILLDA